MAKQEPRLMYGGLSGRVYVVTKYKELANGNIEAIQKYDVTDDFNRILPVEPIASTDVQYGVRFRDKETRPLSKEAACALAAWMPDSFTVATREIRQGPWQVQP